MNTCSWLNICVVGKRKPCSYCTEGPVLLLESQGNFPVLKKSLKSRPGNREAEKLSCILASTLKQSLLFQNVFPGNK